MSAHATLDEGGGSLTIGERSVPVRLDRSDRKTLGITVHPDGIVELRAPRGTSLETIEQRLVKRSSWVADQIARFDVFRPRTPARRYVSGETHRLLGRQYRLKLNPDAQTGVRIAGDRLTVGGTAATNSRSTEQALNRWYAKAARRAFTERLEAVLPRFRSQGISEPTIAVRNLSQRWGSMSRDGASLVLNTRLVEAAPELIDYVLAHELAHVTYPNHGPAFIDLMDRTMPDWRSRKDKLERTLL